MTLDYMDYEILAVLSENYGLKTGDVISSLHKPSSRKTSALMYRRLYSLAAGGYVREMDNDRPIVWMRTGRGSDALKAAGKLR